MIKPLNSLLAVLALLVAIGLPILTSVAIAEEQTISEFDPFERTNRAIYKFNSKLDQAVLRPVAKGYKEHVPAPVRKGFGNFFSNLWEPYTLVNDLLQGKPKKAHDAAARFLLNTTLGIGGILDVATELDVPKHREDLGETLGVWGLGSGPYLMLPFFGPSTVRDTAGFVAQMLYADPLSEIAGDYSLLASSVRLIGTRADYIGPDETLYMQVDEYAFLRETYRQARLKAVYDGNVPVEEDPFEEDLFSE